MEGGVGGESVCVCVRVGSVRCEWVCEGVACVCVWCGCRECAV